MSELWLFTAPLLQPPISNTLGKAGAQCAPRKCDCGSCPLARCSLHCADGAGSASAPLPGGRASEMAEGRQDSSSRAQAELCGRGTELAPRGTESDRERRGEAAPGWPLSLMIPAPARRAFSFSLGWKERWARHLHGLVVSPASCYG